MHRQHFKKCCPTKVVWRYQGYIITDNGDTILISDYNTSMQQNTSELTVNGNAVGIYSYLCTVSISVPGGHDVFAYNTGTVTVKGNAIWTLKIVLAYSYADKMCI